jgi:tetratricopeptide (TPR) repeat protein
MRVLMAIGVLLLAMSSPLSWISGPISGGANPSVSFGWSAVLIGGMAGIAWLYSASRALVVCAGLGLGLGIFSVLYLALMDPALWSLVDENAQAANIILFSSHYLPSNFGIAPAFQPNLSTETLIGRLATAFYFMGLGWWVCLLGSLSLLSGCLTIKAMPRLRWMALTAMVACGSQGLLLGKGVVAQYFQDRGDRYMARGQYAEAVRQYEAALRYDRQLAGSERLHRYCGEAYYHLGTPSHPQARLYAGDRYARERNPEAAIAEYRLAAQGAAGPWTSILHHRLAWTYVQLGVVQYGRQESGGAIAWWEKALSIDASQLQAAYFLMRAYFDQGRYEQSIAMGQFLIGRAQNPLFMADVQANIGDSYWKLKDFSRARLAYETSKKLDTYANFRILWSLGGT